MYIENRHGRKRHRDMKDLGKEGRDSEEGDDIIMEGLYNKVG